MRISLKSAAFFIAAACAMSLTSCDLYNKMFNKEKEDKTAVKKEVVLPQDRVAIEVKPDPKTYSPAEFAKGVVKGDWAIERVYDREAVGATPPYLKFSASDGRIYGNNGCNTVNGDYVYNPADSTLTFDHVAVTMMLCHEEGITDFYINRALSETRKYSLHETDDGYTMRLYNERGEDIMLLTHQNLDFLNGTWKVTAIDGEDVNVDKMKLVFDVDEHKVHGNTGCNVLNGRLETDMDEPNTFSFEAIGVTMMMCPTIEYQTAMLVALEDACRAKPIDKNRVQLLNQEGQPVMTLQRTSDK